MIKKNKIKIRLFVFVLLAVVFFATFLFEDRLKYALIDILAGTCIVVYSTNYFFKLKDELYKK